MGKLHHNFFPIDLVLADQLFPMMESAAINLEQILQLYQNLDSFFWRNFIELFTDQDELPPTDKVWSTLIKLRDTAKSDNLITEPLLRLSHNNDRIIMAQSMLAMVLKR